MVKNEFFYPSADGKTQIHAVEWLPDGEVLAVLQIAHGVAEYILRYEDFARYLTGRGFAVVGNDHIGHGQSVAPGAQPLYFGPKGSWNRVVDDLYRLRQDMGKKYPGKTYFMLGHSMGSFLLRTYLIRYPGTLDAAVIMGTGQQPAVMTTGGQLLAPLLAGKKGEDSPSELVEKLAFGGYNKQFAPNRTGYDWLSVNEENVDRYIADPLCGGKATVGLFREMLWGLGFIRGAGNLKKMDVNTPILFVSGACDPVGANGKGVRQAYESFREAGVVDVTLRLYPGLRHEILNEDGREQVYLDIYEWLGTKAIMPLSGEGL